MMYIVYAFGGLLVAVGIEAGLFYGLGIDIGPGLGLLLGFGSVSAGLILCERAGW